MTLGDDHVRKLEEEVERAYRDRLMWRGVDERSRCSKCTGSGAYMYPDTSTWHGGMGGQAFTRDVCDECWGSGDTANPWFNLRANQSTIRGLQHTPGRRWKEAARSFRRRWHNVAFNVIQLQKEVRRWYDHAQENARASSQLSAVLTVAKKAQKRDGMSAKAAINHIIDICEGK